MNRFWRWVQNKAPDNGTSPKEQERTLFLDGAIAEDDPWFDDKVTPTVFKDELGEGKGPVTVWINSPGGDVFAAAQIYNMLLSYPGHITVKIDGLAASAASVIAMAGDEVLVSPVSMLMIHNPSTFTIGNKSDMEKAISMLDEIKESIINAYMNKTGLSRKKLSDLMDAETWMNARKAVELGFADAVMTRKELEGSLDLSGEEVPLAKTEQKAATESKPEGNLENKPENKPEKSAGDDKIGTGNTHDRNGTGYLFQTRALATAFLNKVENLSAKEEIPVNTIEEGPDNGLCVKPDDKPKEQVEKTGNEAKVEKMNPPENTGKDGTRKVEDLMARLDLIHSLM